MPGPGGWASLAQTAALWGENCFAAIVPQGVLLVPLDAFCWLLSGNLWGVSETTPKSALELSPGVCPQPKPAQSLAGVGLCSLGLPALSRSSSRPVEGHSGVKAFLDKITVCTGWEQQPGRSHTPSPQKASFLPDHPAPSSIGVGWLFQHWKKKAIFFFFSHFFPSLRKAKQSGSAAKEAAGDAGGESPGYRQTFSLLSYT